MAQYYTTVAGCQTNLTNYANFWGSLQGQVSAGENSIECRVYHSNAGAYVDPVHCGHVGDPSPFCNGNITTDAGHYCGTQQGVCTPPQYNQYNNWTQCMNSFMAFPDSPVLATVSNDRGSRQYHTQVAASAPANIYHCSHGGPSGGGTVGSTTQSWFLLSQQAGCKVNPNNTYVSASVGNAWLNWLLTDLQTIVPVDPLAPNYTTGAAGNLDTCRIYHLTVASQFDFHCPHGDILGGGVCGNVVTAACNWIQQACGTTLFATEAACETPITNAFIAPMKMGSATDTTGDSLACRLYYATLALNLKKTGLTNYTNYCPNIAVAGSVCLGMAPHSAAPAVVVGASAVLLSLFV